VVFKEKMEIIYREINTDLTEAQKEEREQVLKYSAGSNRLRENFESQVQDLSASEKANDDNWFMTMFKKIINQIATAV